MRTIHALLSSSFSSPMHDAISLVVCCVVFVVAFSHPACARDNNNNSPGNGVSLSSSRFSFSHHSGLLLLLSLPLALFPTPPWGRILLLSRGQDRSCTTIHATCLFRAWLHHIALVTCFLTTWLTRVSGAFDLSLSLVSRSPPI